MTTNGTRNGHSAPRETQAASRRCEADGRDDNGRFVAGNKAGQSTWFRPGESGNPNGRPRSARLSDLVQERLEHAASTMPMAKKLADRLGCEADAVTLASLVVEVLIEMSLDGDLDAIKEVLNRVDGRSVAKVDASVSHGQCVVFQGVDPSKAFGGAFVSGVDPDRI